MLVRKVKKNYETYIPKRQKGISITERSFDVDDRLFLVTGSRDGKSGAILTLIERKTRFYYMSKSSKQVYMAINKLYCNAFSEIFKTITI